MKPKTTKKTSQTPARRVASRPRTEPRPHAPAMSEDLHDRIVKRAYEIYVRRIHQGALDDWLQAEREVLQLNTGYPEAPHPGGYAGKVQE